MKVTNYKENAIESVLSEFDFDKVIGVMRKIEWAENDSTSSYSLIELARNLLDDAWELSIENKEQCSASSFGLEAIAYWDYKEQKIYSLELKFVVTSWEHQL